MLYIQFIYLLPSVSHFDLQLHMNELNVAIKTKQLLH